MANNRKANRSPQAVERANRQTAKEIAKICRAGRAENILILDLRRLCDFTDYFVIASGTSSVQLRGIAEEIRRAMRARNWHLLADSGAVSDKWFLLDYGDVVVHLFDPAARAFYALEDLWGDAKRVSF